MDVNGIFYEFESLAVFGFIWLSGQMNLADPDTKADSPLTEQLKLTLATRRLALDFSDAVDMCDSNGSLV